MKPKIYNIENAEAGKLYQVFIPAHAAKTIGISLEDGYGGYCAATLEEGFYTALFRHHTSAIGQPKTWEIYERASSFTPESDSAEIKGFLLKDLKKELTE